MNTFTRGCISDSGIPRSENPVMMAGQLERDRFDVARLSASSCMTRRSCEDRRRLRRGLGAVGMIEGSDWGVVALPQVPELYAANRRQTILPWGATDNVGNTVEGR